MHEFPKIPIVEIGPGSQPADEDSLDYLSMPASMRTYRNPIMPEPEDCANVNAGKEVLERVLALLRQCVRGSCPQTVDISTLSTVDREFVNQALGEGEVSILCQGPLSVRAQEAVLAGVWRVQHFDPDEHLVKDMVEIGDVPDLVRSTAFAGADQQVATACDDTDGEFQNAPALLVELAERIASYRPGTAAHTLNLTLLPLSDGDLALLGERLGVGPVTILSRGYGNCRIGSTAKSNVWWIKYFNSQDGLILNTIEIVDVPLVAQAAPEDIRDSAERLDEILELYR